MRITASLFICCLFCSLLSAQKCYVFIGSYCTDTAKESIYVYQLDTASGKLTKVTAVKDILNPSYLVVSPDKKYIFACSETENPVSGSVSSFHFNAAKKSLQFISKQESGGANPCYVSVHKNGKWLIAGNYTGGSFGVLPITEGGFLQPLVQNMAFSDSSINKQRQEKSHIHAAVFSPDYNYIFFPDLGADKIRSFKFESAQSEPVKPFEPTSKKTLPGSGPRHFTFHPNGKYAYSVEELSGTISAYKYKNGNLDNIERVYAYSKKYSTDFGGADIHISPDGKFLYTSNRIAENTIAIFSVALNGKLTLVGHQSTLGEHPRNFAIEPNGKFLLVANKISGDIVVFRRDLKSGLLTPMGKKIKIKDVSCIQMVYE